MHPLQQLRTARGLSRETLAATAGVSPRTIYGIEVERRQPLRATARVLALALECEPGSLLPNDTGPAANGAGSQEADNDGLRRA